MLLQVISSGISVCCMSSVVLMLLQAYILLGHFQFYFDTCDSDVVYILISKIGVLTPVLLF